MRTLSRSCVLALLLIPLLAGASTLPKVHHSKIVLADSIVRLVQEGVIDPRKVEMLYAQRGGVPQALKRAMAAPSQQPILLTGENAKDYVTLLWPLGLANHMAANSQSPMYARGLYRFASTGGWTLGKEANGGAYFDRFPIVELSAAQERLVVNVARRAFRPCCDNSTFFQDCNHGSALLGLLALGASQGLGEEQLFREALAFSAFWFPHQYAHTALYFKAVRGMEWRDIDPREVLGASFSSANGWQANVALELRRRGLVPQRGDAACNV